MDLPQTRIIRVCPATVIIFSVLLSPLLFPAVSMILRKQQLAEAVGFCAAYFGFLYVVCSPTVELSRDGLVYKALFKRRAIAFSEIRGVRMSAHPAPTLELKRLGAHAQPFSFIVKPFSKAGVIAILSDIRSNCPDANFDDVSNDMEHGDFKYITREAIASQNIFRIVLIVGTTAFLVAIGRVLFGK